MTDGPMCPECLEPLVEVDNPYRRELRHRRGTVCKPISPELRATLMTMPFKRGEMPVGWNFTRVR